MVPSIARIRPGGRGVSLTWTPYVRIGHILTVADSPYLVLATPMSVLGTRNFLDPLLVPCTPLGNEDDIFYQNEVRNPEFEWIMDSSFWQHMARPPSGSLGVRSCFVFHFREW